MDEDWGALMRSFATITGTLLVVSALTACQRQGPSSGPVRAPVSMIGGPAAAATEDEAGRTAGSRSGRGHASGARGGSMGGGGQGGAPQSGRGADCGEGGSSDQGGQQQGEAGDASRDSQSGQGGDNGSVQAGSEGGDGLPTRDGAPVSAGADQQSDAGGGVPGPHSSSGAASSSCESNGEPTKTSSESSGGGEAAGGEDGGGSSGSGGVASGSVSLQTLQVPDGDTVSARQAGSDAGAGPEIPAATDESGNQSGGLANPSPTVGGVVEATTPPAGGDAPAWTQPGGAGEGGGAAGGGSGQRAGEGAGGSGAGEQGAGGGVTDAAADTDAEAGLAGATGADAAKEGRGEDQAPQHGAGATQGEASQTPTEQHVPREQDHAAPRPMTHEEFRRAIEAAETASEAPESNEPWHDGLAGVWECVSVEREGEDFLPGGAHTRLLALDPAARQCRIELHWGDDGRIIHAAEVEVGFRPRVVEVLPDPERPSLFPFMPPELLDGAVMTQAALSLPQELPWRLSGDRLDLGGATYRRVSPDRLAMSQQAPEWTEQEVVLEGGGPATTSTEEVPTVDFFGVQSTGRLVCYIVDVSGSMGNSGGILRLRTELERSLGGLPSGTRFAVLPFNSTLLELQPRWATATPMAVARVGRRLSEVHPSGGTNPAEAFEWAFRTLDPRPDEIFFMTDGQVNAAEALSDRLAALNAGAPRTRIHTIGFGQGADGGFLSGLAAQHGGQFVRAN